MDDRDLTATDYLRFINAKRGKPKCPLCQEEEWSLINETEGRSYGLTNTSRASPDFGDMRTALVLLLSCKNCGFIAPILREKVVRETGGSDA